MVNMVINAGEAMIEDFEKLSKVCSFPREDDYWNRMLDLQKDGHVSIFLAIDDDTNCGFVIFNRRPKYNLFRKMKIPEIQDLFVLPEYRGSGFGRKLVNHCEKLAVKEGYEEVGIGVGVLPSYGSAQALYVSMGYVPDGQGMNRNRETIKENDNFIFNHDLSLMFIKQIN